MKSKKSSPKSGVTAFTWFLFSVFVVISLFCIGYINKANSEAAAVVIPAPVEVVKQPSKTPSKAPVQKIAPKVIKK